MHKSPYFIGTWLNMHKYPYFIMSHPLIEGFRMTLFVGGTGCQIIKVAVMEANSLGRLCMIVVKLDGISRYLRNVLDIVSLDSELIHIYCAFSHQVMFVHRCVMRHRILTRIWNITVSTGDEGNIIARFWFHTVESMDGIGIDNTLHCFTFMKDRLGRNVGMDQVVIYLT